MEQTNYAKETGKKIFHYISFIYYYQGYHLFPIRVTKDETPCSAKKF